MVAVAAEDGPVSVAFLALRLPRRQLTFILPGLKVLTRVHEFLLATWHGEKASLEAQK